MDSTVIVVFLLALASFTSANPGSSKTANFTSLPPLEKLSHLAFHFLFKDEYTMLRMDTYMVDMRTLLTQNIKVGEGSPLPELKWSFDFSYCLIEQCFYVSALLTSNNTRMTGQKQITSVNTVTPTSFKNSFHCPSFVWHSPDLLLNFSEADWLLGDVYASLNNLSIDTSFNYKYVPELGIQISNLEIDHKIGYIRFNIENSTTVYHDGNVSVGNPWKFDRTDRIIDTWKVFKIEYQDYLQFRVNCFLSGFRLDPMLCNEDESGFVFNQNVLQLIHTIGLHSLDRY